MARWIDAVKAYHAKNGTQFMIPKKGTPAYDEIKKSMGTASGEPAKAEVKAIEKVKPATMADITPAGQSDVKVKKRRTPRKAVEQIDVITPEAIVSKKRVTKAKGTTSMEELLKESGADKLKASAESKTSLGKLDQAIANTKKYKEEVKKTIDEGKKVSAKVEEHDASPADKTVEELKTDDVPAVEGEVGFSFYSMKKKLGIN